MNHDQIPRSDHIDWCKDRALAYLPSYRTQALMSMISDLGKHPETKQHVGIDLLAYLLTHNQIPSVAECRKLIFDFN